MFKTGIVVAQDLSRVKVRVRFSDLDGMISYWLPVLQRKTLNDKAYWMPDINEHVVCLMDDNYEEGYICGSFYSDADPSPISSADKYYVKFKDGTAIEYDRATHKLSADVKGDVDVKTTGTCKLDSTGAVTIKSSASVTIEAPTIYHKGATSTDGNISVTGNITATGTITDAGGNTNHHNH